jgi:hypothetical protein
MKDCPNAGVYISLDLKTILCEVHKDREKDRYGYFELTQVSYQRDVLLNQLELIFIDFQTCLAIVDMLVKEEKVIEIRYSDIKNFLKLLEDEMNKLNDWLSGGIFDLNYFLHLHLIDDPSLTFLAYFSSTIVFSPANKGFMHR